MPLPAWPKPFQYFKNVRVFFIVLSAVVAVFVGAIFAYRYVTYNNLLLQRAREQAKSYARLIVLTRNWNAHYGGVYVEKKGSVRSNPYLEELGIEADVRATDGRVFTLRNPSIMTREISQLARDRKDVQFHMTSLHFLNPENAPDPFERKALEQFERGVKEVWGVDRTITPPVFRYVLPLPMEEPCLNCHRRQGYKLGGIRGGISISVPFDGFEKEMAYNRWTTVISAVMTLGLLLGILYLMTWKLVLNLDVVQKRLKQIAVTDELTGLKNRRYIMEHLAEEYQRAVRSGAPLSIIILDIDHFKKINDTRGHSFGDMVLKTVAGVMKTSLRGYDLLGRIGGEEFLIASPGSTREEAAGLAERVLSKIRNDKVRSGEIETAVTVSAGVTMLTNQDGNMESLLRRADAALYMAKQTGRDRVVAF